MLLDISVSKRSLRNCGSTDTGGLKYANKLVRSSLNACHVCDTMLGKKCFHPLISIEASMPFEYPAIDLVTPLPMSADGYDTMLVIFDIMTKYAILKCLNGKTMVEVARATWEVLAVFGIPKIIQSDNGTEFVNQLIEEMTSLNGIEHRMISPYNPRANGQVERTNRTIETMLCKELQGAMQKWNEFVQSICYNWIHAIRAHVRP